MSARDHAPIVLPKTFSPQFWADADQRTAAVREIRRRYLELKDHSGADSRQRDLIAQRAAFIEVLLETTERQAIESGKFDAGSYVQSVNCLTGLLKALGLEKKAKPVGDLQSYVKGRKS